jgi:26S proteasome regulatory subunit N7
MAEDKVFPYPNLALSQDHFVLTQPNLAQLHEHARARLLAGIEADQMSPYYKLVVESGVIPLDESLLAKMEKENTDELERLDKKLKEAEEMEGETDIAEVLRAKAMYLTRIGEKVCAHLFSCLLAVSDAGCTRAEKSP